MIGSVILALLARLVGPELVYSHAAVKAVRLSIEEQA